MTLHGLRPRLFLAFVVVAVLPLVLYAVSVTRLLSDRFEADTSLRLQGGLERLASRLKEDRSRAEAALQALVTLDLPAAPPGEDTQLATILGEHRDLAALEIVESDGRVLSSRHWPAGYGLPEHDEVFSGDPALRWVSVASGFGSAQRLAVMPSKEGLLRSMPVTVRGGFFLDEALASDLSRFTGLEVAFRDVARGRWINREDSPFSDWKPPPLSGTSAVGRVILPGGSFDFAARPLAGELWLVVASSRTPVEALLRSFRSYAYALAAAALVLALLSSLLLSQRIAGPVGALAAGARRVAEGDLQHRVAVSSADEIGELAGAFNAMTAELRSSQGRLLQAERVAAWREMARRLAHELKNPLFPIQLSVETLQRLSAETNGEGELASLVAESSRTILEELQALRRIVEEFSEFARMPRPHLAPTDLGELAGGVVALHKAQTEGLVVVTDFAVDLPLLDADRDLLSRALSNLVRNAIEAMPPGGTLRVATSTRKGAVVVEVEDTGPGLEAGQQTRLFTPYYTTKRGGTGLGLAIVQGIVSDQGGEVEVSSVAGRGTTFRLVFPTTGPVSGAPV